MLPYSALTLNPPGKNAQLAKVYLGSRSVEKGEKARFFMGSLTAHPLE